MLFHFKHFSFLPPPLPLSPRYFFGQTELFLSDSTNIFYISPISSSLLLISFLTLTIVCALVNSDLFLCHSFFNLIHFVFFCTLAPSSLPLRTYHTKRSSQFCGSLQLCSCLQDVHWDRLACASAHALETWGHGDSSRNVDCLSFLQIHPSFNISFKLCYASPIRMPWFL